MVSGWKDCIGYHEARRYGMAKSVNDSRLYANKEGATLQQRMHISASSQVATSTWHLHNETITNQTPRSQMQIYKKFRDIS